MSEPTHLSFSQSPHVGAGRGLQIVLWQPQLSVTSTTISHGRHIATLMAGHSFLTHSFSHGQQHSIPLRSDTVRSTSHLSHLGSAIFGQLASFSVQHLHGRHWKLASQTPFTCVVSRYSPLAQVGGFGGLIRVDLTTHLLNSNLHSRVTQGSFWSIHVPSEPWPRG